MGRHTANSRAASLSNPTHEETEVKVDGARMSDINRAQVEAIVRALIEPESAHRKELADSMTNLMNLWSGRLSQLEKLINSAIPRIIQLERQNTQLEMQNTQLEKTVTQLVLQQGSTLPASNDGEQDVFALL